MRAAEQRSGWAGDTWPEGESDRLPVPAEPPAAPESWEHRPAVPLLRVGWIRQTLAATLLVALVLAAVRAPAPIGAAARRGIAWALGYDVNLAAIRRQMTRLGDGLGLTAGPRAAPQPSGVSPQPAAAGGLPTPMGRLIPPAIAPVSAWFGWREVAGRPRFNPSIDLSTPVGTPVHAVAAGTLERLRPSIVLRHRDGWQSVYGRCAPVGLRVGQAVGQGEVVCRSTAGGLLFQLLVGGRAIDPAPYIGLRAPTVR